MATAGPNIAGTGTNGGFGGVSWTDPGNITADDATRASVWLTTGTPESDYLVASNFGFSIPAGAAIDGVLVEVEARARTSPDDAYFSSPQLLSGGFTGSSGTGTVNSDLIAATDTIYTNGGSTDKWTIPTHLTPTNVNDSSFGYRLRVAVQTIDQDVQVDQVRITVYYTEASGGARCVQTRQAVNRASSY